MEQATLLALKCPGCGAPLKINDKIRDFACTYCGNSVQVERGDGIVSLHLLNNALQGVKQGTDKTAAELAIRRLTDEMHALEVERLKRDAEYTEVWNHWKAHLDAVGSQSATIALVAVAICVGAFTYAVTGGICWAVFKAVSPLRAQAVQMADAGLPDAYFTSQLLVVATAIGLASVYLLKTMARGKRRQMAVAAESRARALVGPEGRCEDVRKRIETARVRLKRNQELVDS